MDPPEPPAGPPVFVVGCGRSGTTMLRLMLDVHPDLAIPSETHVIPSLWRQRRRFETDGRFDAAKLTDHLLHEFRIERWEIPEATIRRRVDALTEPTYASVWEAFFKAYADHQGKRRWGDKTPAYVIDIPLLSELFPTARFVHLVRDGRDVSQSLVESDMFPDRLVKAAEYWSILVRKGREFGTALEPGRYLETRYEELVADPEPELRRICDFLDLSFQPAMLAFHERADEKIGEDPRKLHESVHKPATTGLRSWERDMDPRDVAVVEAIGGRTLRDFGYPLSTTRPPVSVRIRAGAGVLAYRTRRAFKRNRNRVAARLKGYVPAGY